ncbi:MAG: hypothetical protein RBQ91_03165 [Acholeplasma sp.]|nr:hypothetical protein [Acholeplasma sp.]
MKKPLKTPLLVDLEQTYSFSMIKAYVFNLLAFITATGLSMQLKVDHWLGFVLLTVLYTLLEVMAVNLLRRYAMKQIYRTFGLLLLLVYVLLIYGTISIVPDVYFQTLIGFIGFTLIFLVIRVLLLYYYDKLIQNKRRHL